MTSIHHFFDEDRWEQEADRHRQAQTEAAALYASTGIDPTFVDGPEVDVEWERDDAPNDELDRFYGRPGSQRRDDFDRWDY